MPVQFLLGIYIFPQGTTTHIVCCMNKSAFGYLVGYQEGTENIGGLHLHWISSQGLPLWSFN